MAIQTPERVPVGEVFDVFWESNVVLNHFDKRLAYLYNRQQAGLAYEKAGMRNFALQNRGAIEIIEDLPLPEEVLHLGRVSTNTRQALELARQSSTVFEQRQQARARFLLAGTELGFSLMDFDNGPVGVFGVYKPESKVAVYNYTDIPSRISGVFIDATPRGIVTVASIDSPTGYYSVETINVRADPPIQQANMTVIS